MDRYTHYFFYRLRRKNAMHWRKSMKHTVWVIPMSSSSPLPWNIRAELLHFAGKIYWTSKLFYFMVLQRCWISEIFEMIDCNLIAIFNKLMNLYLPLPWYIQTYLCFIRRSKYLNNVPGHTAGICERIEIGVPGPVEQDK